MIGDLLLLLWFLVIPGIILYIGVRRLRKREFI